MWNPEEGNGQRSQTACGNRVDSHPKGVGSKAYTVMYRVCQLLWQIGLAKWTYGKRK